VVESAWIMSAGRPPAYAQSHARPRPNVTPNRYRPADWVCRLPVFASLLTLTASRQWVTSLHYLAFRLARLSESQVKK